MEWTFRNDQPIYAQLVSYLMRDIVSGAYAPGERLPAVRELATRCSVNPNTMQRAFSELERLGLVESLRTSGRFVTSDEKRISGARRMLARTHVDEFLSSMRSIGYDREAVLALLGEFTSRETTNEEEEH